MTTPTRSVVRHSAVAAISTLTAVLLLMSCDAAPAPGPVPGPPTGSPAKTAVAQSVTLNCEMPLADVRRPQSSPVLNAVSIPAYPAKYRRTAETNTGPPYRFFAKTGLNVRAGQRVTLRLVDQRGNRIAIGWGTNGIRWAKEVVVPGCTSATDHRPWLIYPGGFAMDAVTCVTLKVSAGGQTSTLRVPVGKDCS